MKCKHCICFLQNFITTLENQHKSGELSLQSLSFAAQAHIYKMEYIARIISTITLVCTLNRLNVLVYYYLFQYLFTNIFRKKKKVVKHFQYYMKK